jgi:hypothetical protein
MHGMVILLNGSLQNVGDRIRFMFGNAGAVLADIAVAAAIGLIGWLLARLLSRLTLVALRAMHFNDAIRSVGEAPGGRERWEPAAIVSWAIYWMILLFTAHVAAQAAGLDLTVSVGERLRDVLPRVAAATIELVIGILLAMALGAVTRRVFETAGARGSRLRGQIVTFVMSGFAVLVALEQLGLAATFIMALAITAMAAVGLAAALAFGLGCRDLARDFIVEFLRSGGDETPRRPL